VLQRTAACIREQVLLLTTTKGLIDTLQQLLKLSAMWALHTWPTGCKSCTIGSTTSRC
jgi:hypothetical protein